jgi:hypothetical protein
MQIQPEELRSAAVKASRLKLNYNLHRPPYQLEHQHHLSRDLHKSYPHPGPPEPYDVGFTGPSIHSLVLPQLMQERLMLLAPPLPRICIGLLQ